jgi:hypothetical protein
VGTQIVQLCEASFARWGLLLVVLGDGRFFTLGAGGKHV